MSGKNGSPVDLSAEVIEICAEGLWLGVGGERLWLAYVNFPWFADRPAEQVRAVEQPSAGHLYWPELDIDLSLASVRDPSAFPLVAQV